MRDNPRRDAVKIAQITGAYAAAGVVAVGGIAAVTAGVVTVLSREEEMVALRQDKTRLKQALNEIETKAQYKSFSYLETK